MSGDDRAINKSGRSDRSLKSVIIYIEQSEKVFQ